MGARMPEMILWTFTGLRLVDFEEDEIDLGSGFSLMKVNN
jgi:hypothetical protein